MPLLRCIVADIVSCSVLYSARDANCCGRRSRSVMCLLVCLSSACALSKSLRGVREFGGGSRGPKEHFFSASMRPSPSYFGHLFFAPYVFICGAVSKLFTYLRLLCKGDEIIEVNGESFESLTHQEAVAVIKAHSKAAACLHLLVARHNTAASRQRFHSFILLIISPHAHLLTLILSFIHGLKCTFSPNLSVVPFYFSSYVLLSRCSGPSGFISPACCPRHLHLAYYAPVYYHNLHLFHHLSAILS